jgi:hypothetical protein
VFSPPLVQGGYTLTAGEGVGGPNSDEGTDTVVPNLYMHFVFTGMGDEHYIQTLCILFAYMCEVLIDRQFFAHFVRNQITELMEGSLEMRLHKNFST